MTRIRLLVALLIAALGCPAALAQDPAMPPPAPPALPQAALVLTTPPSVTIASSVVVTGTTDKPGRLVVIVRRDDGRVLGKVIRPLVPAGRFSVRVPLADVTRPGEAKVEALLTEPNTISPTRAEKRLLIRPASPNFKLVMPTAIPVGEPLPVAGEITFAGRMVIVVRTVSGRVLARRVVRLQRPGEFEIVMRLSRTARPGPIRVTAMLSSGVLSASGRATLRLTKVGPNFELALPTTWPVGKPLPLTGRIAYGGRMVVVVRRPNGRVLGRGVITLRRRGGFRTFLRLDEAARPGPIVVTAILSSGTVSSSGTARLRLTPTGPNFVLALPTTIRRGQAIPVSGRVAFPGRMLIVARHANGRVLGRQVIQVPRAGPFRATLRITRDAQPGTAHVRAELTSGTLRAEGNAALVLI